MYVTSGLPHTPHLYEMYILLDFYTGASKKTVTIRSSCSSDTLSELSINLRLLALEDHPKCGTEGNWLRGRTSVQF